jgi:hypothetical protein
VSQIFYCVYSTGRQAQKDGESSGFHLLSFFALLFLFLFTWTWRITSWRLVRDLYVVTEIPGCPVMGHFAFTSVDPLRTWCRASVGYGAFAPCGSIGATHIDLPAPRSFNFSFHFLFLPVICRATPPSWVTGESFLSFLFLGVVVIFSPCLARAHTRIVYPLISPRPPHRA